MKKLLLGSLFVLCSTSVLAETIINTQTNSWKSVPITVDTAKNTYSTADGFLMPEGDYYYTYSGFRCLKTKVEQANVDPVILKDSKDEKIAIYCYPEK